MDKFCNFVMTPRKEQPTTQSRKIKKTYIQTKLNDCPGVVVIKDLVKAKQILEDKSGCVPSKKKIKILKKLYKKNPSKEVLIQGKASDVMGFLIGIVCLEFSLDLHCTLADQSQVS